MCMITYRCSDFPKLLIVTYGYIWTRMNVYGYLGLPGTQVRFCLLCPRPLNVSKMLL